MKQAIKRVLTEKFGYPTFRPGQSDAIEAILSGKDSLVMLPTGTGKSLCYQLPAYLKQGTTLVISPLLSLMQDQVENLKLQGEKNVVAINSLTPYSERNRIFSNLEKYRFIYTSPEMLQNNEILQQLKRIKINHFIVDEAHCISHWGTDFRPDYLVLARVRKELGNPPTMALTATATKRVRNEIIDFLGLDRNSTEQIIQSVDRPEIKYIVENCEGDKFEKILSYAQQIKGPGVIYFTSKKLAEETAQKLRVDYQIQTECYHSDVEADDRIKIQQQFLQNKFQIICATSAFGMGFDKKDIRFVIHYHMPASPEMYLQEVGRASRDGRESLAILLYEKGDEYIQNNFIQESLPSLDDLIWVQQNKIKAFYEPDALLKLAYYFIESYPNLDEALEKINERKQIKYRQLYYMLQYISTDSCKRQYLLNYFEETVKEKIEVCCMSCGLPLENLMSTLNSYQYFEYNDGIAIASWEKQFKQLYNI